MLWTQRGAEFLSGLVNEGKGRSDILTVMNQFRRAVTSNVYISKLKLKVQIFIIIRI